MDSSNEMEEVRAAKNNSKKKNDPMNPPPGNSLNVTGNVMKMSPGPSVGERPY